MKIRGKNMKKQYLSIVIFTVLLIGFTGCGNPSGGDSEPQSIVYKSSAGSTTYELTITATVKIGDSYILKITNTKTSTGTIKGVSGDILTLKPSSSDTTFTITIGSGGMTDISGSIQLDGGGVETGPGTVIPSTPAKFAGTWVKDSAPSAGHKIIFNGNTITFPDTNPSPVTGTFTFTDTEITGTNSSGTMTFSDVLNGNSLTLSNFPAGMTGYNGTWTRQ
jgi:hypothetical protein